MCISYVASIVLILIACESIVSAQVLQYGGVAPGGRQNLSPEELTSTEHLERAIKILRTKEGYSSRSSQPTILSGTTQVVAGFKYEYTVVYKEDDEHRVCKLTAWERDWLVDKQPDQAFIYSSTCV